MLESVVIFPNVHLADDIIIEDYSIVGTPPRGYSHGELETRIGPKAVIRSHSVIYAGNVIGSQFQCGHGIMIREFNIIGNDVSIGTHSIVEHHVTIGDGVRIHSDVFIPEYSVLEEGCWIGPSVVFTNARYPSSPGAKRNLQGPRILAGAKIGANSTLLPGVTIGRNALVGAGSVVVRDVPDSKVVAGNPAVVINDIQKLSAYTTQVTPQEP